jgi:hypothetical protein
MLVLGAATVLSGIDGISRGLAQGAGSPEALPAARELATLTAGAVISEVVTAMTSQVWPVVEASLRVKNPTIDAPTLTALRREFEQLEVNAIREVMIDGAPIYARYFTANELREMIAFYRTPTGAKALAVMPRASLELLQSLAPRMQPLSESVNRSFAAILQQRGFQP